MPENSADRREQRLVAVCFAAVALSALIVASIFAIATITSRESAAATTESSSGSSPSPAPTEPDSTTFDLFLF